MSPPPLNVATSVTLQNPDSQIHDWTIDSIPVSGTAQKIQLLADPGRTVSQTFTFTQAGTYRVYCSQPGHAEAGDGRPIDRSVGRRRAEHRLNAPSRFGRT
ncbi:MAG: hypothetical protein KatS3mg060_3375 [Dehalococcoidia bacterium]|nr:MAG: hypothetical protein KatS3mg060_3375 [Dehalococcoidia bacterium]